jgi:hypothetical protein
LPGILHRWNDQDGNPALQIDANGNVYFGDANEAVITPEGGLAVWFQNRTGAPTMRGMLVTLGTAPSSVIACPYAIPKVMGVIYSSGVANGEFVRVVVSGVAYCLFENAQSPTVGYWVGLSDTVDGRAQARATMPDNSGAGIDLHNKEIGHCIDTVAPGTDVLARVVLHFN